LSLRRTILLAVGLAAADNAGCGSRSHLSGADDGKADASAQGDGAPDARLLDAGICRDAGFVVDPSKVAGEVVLFMGRPGPLAPGFFYGRASFYPEYGDLERRGMVSRVRASWRDVLARFQMIPLDGCQAYSAVPFSRPDDTLNAGSGLALGDPTGARVAGRK